MGTQKYPRIDHWLEQSGEIIWSISAMVGSYNRQGTSALFRWHVLDCRPRHFNDVFPHVDQGGRTGSDLP